jgi:hypothetical protein
LNTLGYLGGILGKLRSHSRREVEHFHPLILQANLPQPFFDRFNPPAGIEITCQVMTIPRQSPGSHHAIGPTFKSMEHLDDI